MDPCLNQCVSLSDVFVYVLSNAGQMVHDSIEIMMPGWLPKYN